MKGSLGCYLGEGMSIAILRIILATHHSMLLPGRGHEGVVKILLEPGDPNVGNGAA